MSRAKSVTRKACVCTVASTGGRAHRHVFTNLRCGGSEFWARFLCSGLLLRNSRITLSGRRNGSSWTCFRRCTGTPGREQGTPRQGRTGKSWYQTTGLFHVAVHLAPGWILCWHGKLNVLPCTSLIPGCSFCTCLSLRGSACSGPPAPGSTRTSITQTVALSMSRVWDWPPVEGSLDSLERDVLCTAVLSSGDAAPFDMSRACLTTTEPLWDRSTSRVLGTRASRSTAWPRPRVWTQDGLCYYPRTSAYKLNKIFALLVPENAWEATRNSSQCW